MRRIRIFEEKDIPQAAGTLMATPLFHQYGLTLERAHSMLEEKLKDPGHHLYTAEIENEFAGMIDIAEKGLFAISPYVQLLAVNLRFNKMGIGKALMAYAEEKYKSKYGIGLLVNETNEDAILFYERLGYQRIGKIDGYIRPGLNELIYFKS